MSSADRLEARLLKARDRVELVFLDECTISRDPEQHDDDELDLDTGVLVPPDPDSSAVYAGRCAFLPQSRVTGDPEADAEQHAAQSIDPHYEWRGPLAETPALQKGDLITCTASRLDEQLVGRVFRVTERPATSSVGVLRVAQIEALP